MRPWYERDPGRLLREHREVTEQYPGGILVRDGDLLSWRITLTVEERDYVVRAAYPAAFPHKRIDVVPVDPPWRNKTHQTADGRMCLLSYVPNRWDPSYTAAFMLDRVTGWIGMQLGKGGLEHLGQVPFWDGQYWHATYLSEDAAPFLRQHGCGEFHALEWPERKLQIVTRLSSFGGAELYVSPSDKFFTAMGIPRRPERKGIWLHSDVRPPWLHWPESFDEASRFMKDHSDCPKGVRRLRRYIERQQEGQVGNALPVIVVHPRDSKEPENLDGSGFRAAVVGGEEYLFPSRLLLADFGKEIMSRNSGVVDLAALARKTVCVVGVGAVGSTAAVALAKAGVQRFHLFDHEKVEPGNVARHACDLRDVGKSKVDAVGDLIIRRNPDAVITPNEANVLSDENIGTLAETVEKSDIVLVATGDRESAGLVNRLSLDARTETVYTSVLAGARGGEVFRVTPFRTPCFQCIQRYKLGDERWEAVTRYDEKTGPEAPTDGCGAVFMPGTGVDTETIALAQARLTLQTLLRTEPGATYHDEVCDYLLIGTARGEPFEGTYHVIKEDSYRDRVPDCEQCGIREGGLDEAGRRLYESILEEAEE